MRRKEEKRKVDKEEYFIVFRVLGGIVLWTKFLCSNEIFMCG